MKKRFIAVCLAAAACVLLSTTIHTAMLQRDMSQKVLRFHVLANSDSQADQALKCAVRDRVGTMMAEKLQNADSLEESTDVTSCVMKKSLLRSSATTVKMPPARVFVR